MFQGMGLLAPFVGIKDETMMDKYIGVARFISKVFPNLKLAPFPIKKGEGPKPHYLHFLQQPI